MLNPVPAYLKTGVANRATFGFGLGAVAALVVMAMLPRLLFGFLSTSLPLTQPFLPAVSQVGLLVAFFADGAIGGWWLGIHRRATLAFASGFLVAGFFMSRMFTYIRFLSAAQSAPAALGTCAALGVFGFGSAGLAGGLGLGGSGVWSCEVRPASAWEEPGEAPYWSTPPAPLP